MSFFYGDTDWMDKNGGQTCIEKNSFYGAHSKVHIVPTSDHHMYFDNPEEFTSLILEDL
jgi:pimeloyl-ACP methyl ester carboxylesterase